MPRKKKTPEQIAAEMKHLRMAQAGCIRDNFPDVKMIHLTFTFADFDKQVGPSTKNFSLGPEHSASFEYQCAYWECVQGGFDLGPPVRQLVRSKELELRGEATCLGWQDKERLGKHRCYGKLSYQIKVEYA